MVLDNDRLDLAVARGAAYYGMVRRGAGRADRGGAGADVLHRRRGGNVRAIDQRATGDCRPSASLPASAEPGQEIELADREFELLVSEPVEFPLYTSSTRLTDRPGELVAVDPEQMTALPPIRTVLRARGKAERGALCRVRLHARLTEIGTLELWCSRARGPAKLAAAVRRPHRDADRRRRARGAGERKASSTKRRGRRRDR